VRLPGFQGYAQGFLKHLIYLEVETLTGFKKLKPWLKDEKLAFMELWAPTPEEE
jgi:hypothetical protein